MTRSRGFTLIELMITVAIVAILAAIAIPSYSEYLRRGRVTEAVSTLSGMRVKMEQYFQDNRTYIGACGGAGIAKLPSATESFTYACPTLALGTYTITATGNAGTSVEGFQYTLDQTNARTSVMTSPSTWLGNSGCWALKKDGSC